jgi:hypothetical protein
MPTRYYQNLNKIDSYATNGIRGTVDSLSYRVHTIELHNHSNERWFGKATTPNGEIHVADRLGVNNGSFQTDAGNDTWGDWIQIIGSSDTPVTVSMVSFDLHGIQIEAAERTSTYYIQLAYGSTGEGALALNQYNEFPFTPQSVQGKPAPLKIQTPRIAVGTKMWIRVMCPGQNTATLNFYIGLHEYDG